MKDYFGIPQSFSLDDLSQFKKNLVHHTIDAFDGVKLNYVSYTQKKSIANLIIVGGRTESYLLYEESLFDFARQDFDLYMMDHRGQGLSERLTPDAHVGHVNDFYNYTLDLNIFIEKVVSLSKKPQVILSHSMGGCISLDYLLQFKNQIKGAVLMAPMLDILLPAPRWMIKLLATTLYHTSLKNSYIPFGEPYQPQSFEGNLLTHDAVRYQRYVDTIQNNSEIQLGSPSVAWLYEALNTCDEVMHDKNKLTTPCLIIQASDDRIVDNRAQNRFAENQPYVSLFVAEGAQHQVLLEKDSVRNQVLEKILTFYKEVIA